MVSRRGAADGADGGRFAALAVARATSCAGFFAVLPYLGLWLVEDRGFSGGRAGLVVGACILANRAGAVLLVSLIHRLGLKSSVVTGYLGAVVVFTLLGTGLRLPFPGWLALAALVGLCLAMSTTAMKAMVAAFPAEQRLRGFSYLNMAVNAGSAVGPVIGGQLLDWHAGLPLAAAALHLVALAVALALPGGWRPSPTPPPAGPAAGSGRARRLLPQRALVQFSLLACGTWLAYAQVMDVLPAYLGSAVNARDLGLVFTLNAVMVVALQVPVSWVSRRVLDRPRGGFGPLWAAAGAVLAVSVLLFAFGRSAGLGLVLAAMVLFTLSELVWSPLYDAQISERRGALSPLAAYALAGVASGAAESVGAWLGTLLVVHRPGTGSVSSAAPYWGAAALALATGAAMWWTGRAPSGGRPSTHQPPPAVAGAETEAEEEGEGNDHDVDVSARA